MAWRSLISFSIFIGFLAACVVGTYFVVTYSIDLLAVVDKSTLPLILLLVLTLLLCARMVAAAIRNAPAKEAIRRQRVVVYGHLLGTLQSLMGSHNGPPEEANLQSLESDLLLCGSTEVIRGYLAVRTRGAFSGDKAQRLEKLLKEMRNDLGYGNRGLQEGDLLALAGFTPTPEDS